MISETFYKKLPPDLQAMVVDLWKENIGAYRKQMEDAQLEARRTLEKNGMQFFSPPESKLVEIRQKMTQNQDSVAKELRISPAMQDLVKAEFKSEATR
jgi:TRAP-type C4-dicarboxylate transport system substrate-binding protein